MLVKYITSCTRYFCILYDMYFHIEYNIHTPTWPVMHNYNALDLIIVDTLQQNYYFLHFVTYNDRGSFKIQFGLCSVKRSWRYGYFKFKFYCHICIQYSIGRRFLFWRTITCIIIVVSIPLPQNSTILLHKWIFKIRPYQFNYLFNRPDRPYYQPYSGPSRLMSVEQDIIIWHGLTSVDVCSNMHMCIAIYAQYSGAHTCTHKCTQ